MFDYAKRFLEKAYRIHGNKYDYSLMEYKTCKEKIKIICLKHGVFEQIPDSHVQKCGCPKCGFEISNNKKRILCRANKSDFSHITPPQGSRIIPLTKGKYALVDEEDYERVNQWNWHSSHGYACNKSRSEEPLRMHRFILNNYDTSISIDHINRIPYDNRKANLRICSHKENSCNTRGQSNRGSSQYKGVGWWERDKKWRAKISNEGVTKHIGYFKTEIEAALAYDAKAKELFGEFAYLNFPVI